LRLQLLIESEYEWVTKILSIFGVVQLLEVPKVKYMLTLATEPTELRLKHVSIAETVVALVEVIKGIQHHTGRRYTIEVLVEQLRIGMIRVLL